MTVWDAVRRAIKGERLRHEATKRCRKPLIEKPGGAMTQAALGYRP